MRITKLLSPRPDEIDQISKLHYQYLTESLLTVLGREFLSCLYRELINDPHSVCLVVKLKSEIIGYLLATTDNRQLSLSRLTRIIRQNPLRNLAIVFFHFGLLSKLFMAAVLTIPKFSVPAELRYLAIETKFQNRGLGTKLVQKLNSILAAKKIRKYLVGTKTDNRRANAFYRKLGFRFLRQLTIVQDKFNYYAKTL